MLILLSFYQHTKIRCYVFSIFVTFHSCTELLRGSHGKNNNNHYFSCCISRYKGEYHSKMERSWKSTSFLDKIFTFKVAACFSFATNDKKKVVYSKPI